MGKFVGNLSYANVMATVAVFVAVGGGAYAAGLAKNSVGSKQVKDGSLKGIDIKDNSLTGADVDESKLTLPKGPKGDQGEQGIQGPPGQDGADGQDGLDGQDGQDGADGLDGADATFAPATFTSFGLASLDPDTGCTGLSNQWVNSNPDDPAAYYRDPTGMVFMSGSLTSCGSTADPILQLPAGFRPAAQRRFSTVSPGVWIASPTGSVQASSGLSFDFQSGDEVRLDGIVFRCGPSGQDGCP